ncbi:nuclear transport factor 2 family protein [Brevundimonas sp.]|uniref:YybH family protein n=1 Tax=Brevundimonas sp. TaxID=1871086 RepID=UPI002730735A|nr:nuclear transport factor 2 family protein [Brevundimonas sp.]MDP1913337.1 nuclear transport factor 2 family protein [Brevundimonas sp.]
MKFPVMGVLLISAALAGCQPATPAPVAPTGAEIAAIAEKAHNDYVAAINSNDTETLMALLTDDVVYQAPNMPEVVGKPAAREWVAGYFGAYRTQWEKTSLDFIVSGDWAFERYAYRSTDTDKATGAVTTDVGKGLNVYRRGTDGVWRIARDSWSSNGPPPAA